MAKYTEYMENALFTAWNFDTDNYADVRTILEEEFRSFGEGLIAIIEKKINNTIDDPIAYILQQAESHNVPVSDIASLNTLKNWFKGSPRPKKGEASRHAMFALAFALGLSTDETAELFHKVYLDRAFDYREPFDVVAYYCLDHNRSWRDLNSLLSQIYFSEITEHTVYTQEIHQYMQHLETEADLLRFISTMAHNMSMRGITAKKQLTKLMDRANQLTQRELECTGQSEHFKGSDKNSRSFTYEMIIGISPSGEKGTVSIFKNANLPKEIRNRFPEAGSFSKKEPTYEEQRKMLILLYSYIFWYQVQHQHCSVDLEDYIAEMNIYLCECGFSELYFGNPYDWMFMYCTLNECPLDTFRGLLEEVLIE